RCSTLLLSSWASCLVLLTDQCALCSPSCSRSRCACPESPSAMPSAPSSAALLHRCSPKSSTPPTTRPWRLPRTAWSSPLSRSSASPQSPAASRIRVCTSGREPLPIIMLRPVAFKNCLLGRAHHELNCDPCAPGECATAQHCCASGARFVRRHYYAGDFGQAFCGNPRVGSRVSARCTQHRYAAFRWL